MIRSWPEDTAQIYREIEEEERWLANTIWPVVVATWPDDQPAFGKREAMETIQELGKRNDHK